MDLDVNILEINLLVTVFVAVLVFLLPLLDRRICARLGVNLQHGLSSNPNADRLLRVRRLILLGVFFVYLLAFARAIAEVGAVSMVGGAIAWKTNVMTTAIMQYTNRGNFTLGIALGLILMLLSLAVNIAVSLMQRRLSR